MNLKVSIDDGRSIRMEYDGGIQDIYQDEDGSWWLSVDPPLDGYDYPIPVLGFEEFLHDAGVNAHEEFLDGRREEFYGTDNI